RADRPGPSPAFLICTRTIPPCQAKSGSASLSPDATSSPVDFGKLPVLAPGFGYKERFADDDRPASSRRQHSPHAFLPQRPIPGLALSGDSIWGDALIRCDDRSAIPRIGPFNHIVRGGRRDDIRDAAIVHSDGPQAVTPAESIDFEHTLGRLHAS